MFSPTPYVTFELRTDVKAEKNRNNISWRLPLNEELFANGQWRISIDAICIHVKSVKQRENETDQIQEKKIRAFKKRSKMFKVFCNVTKSEFHWVSKMRRFVDTAVYPEWQPVEYVTFDSIAVNQDAIFINKDKKLHPVNQVYDQLTIDLQPIFGNYSGYKLNDLNGKASVLLSLYKQ